MSYPEGSGAARSIEEARSGPKIVVVASQRVRDARKAVDDLNERSSQCYKDLGHTTPDQTRLRAELKRQINEINIELVHAKAVAYDIMRSYEIVEPLT